MASGIARGRVRIRLCFASILSQVNLEAVVGHEVVSDGLKLRKRIYIYVLYLGLIFFMFMERRAFAFKKYRFVIVSICPNCHTNPLRSKSYGGDLQFVKCKEGGIGGLGIEIILARSRDSG